MEDDDIAPNTVHTTDSVGMVRKLCQYTIFQIQHEFLPILTGSAVRIWGNNLVFHFVSSSLP